MDSNSLEVQAQSNLILNAGFELGEANWNFEGGAGVATNNPNSGNNLAYLDEGASNKISQSITISQSGTYDFSAWVSAASYGGRIGIEVNGADYVYICVPAVSTYNLQRISKMTFKANDIVTVYVTGGNSWVNVDDFSLTYNGEEVIYARSSNKKLEDAFNWAVPKTSTFVMTDLSGPINKSEGGWDGVTSDYTPSYWAGYANRTAFYVRDLVHQMDGAHLVGLDNENLSMLKQLAATANESRKWYSLWALNFDGSIYTVDYKSDDYFVREIPGVFELVEKGYKTYLWTGEEEYLDDPVLWNFYSKAVTDFITLHDQNGNGIPEGVGNIFEGSSTYNERDGHPKEAGDGLGAQYQAILAYGNMQRLKGDTFGGEETLQRANDLKDYFDTEWSVPDNPNDIYVRGYDLDGNKLEGFGKENSWFMPMKLLTTPGMRNDRYLQFIADNVDGGIEGGSPAPNNIEAYTYLPDTFFHYNWSDEAWKWMEYIIDKRDDAHEVATQGTNGNYPEISYTLISQTVEGMMGVRPNAPENKVATVSRLPEAVDWLEVTRIPLGESKIGIRHNGLTETVLTNEEGSQSLTWEAAFYGNFENIYIDGIKHSVLNKELNGETISYVDVTVNPGQTVTASAVGIIVPELPDILYLSDVVGTYLSQDWGSLGRDSTVDGNTITLNGVTYDKGLGTHANSDIRYNLEGNYKRFTADIGVDDEAGRKGSVIFQVWADGIEVYNSGVMRANTGTKHVDVDVTGVNELKLIVTDGGDGINYDHADWADARVNKHE